MFYMAIKPDSLDNGFTMIEAIEYLVTTDHNSGKEVWKLTETGTCQSYDHNTLDLDCKNSNGLTT